MRGSLLETGDLEFKDYEKLIAVIMEGVDKAQNKKEEYKEKETRRQSIRKWRKRGGKEGCEVRGLTNMGELQEARQNCSKTMYKTIMLASNQRSSEVEEEERLEGKGIFWRAVSKVLRKSRRRYDSKETKKEFTVEALKIIENKELKSFLELMVEYSSEVFRIKQAKGKEDPLEFSKMIGKALQNDASRQRYIKFFRCLKEVLNICLCLFDGNEEKTTKGETAGKRSKGQ